MLLFIYYLVLVCKSPNFEGKIKIKIREREREREGGGLFG